MKTAFFAAMMKAPPCVPSSKIGEHYLAAEELDDNERRLRSDAKRKDRQRRAGYYVVKGSDARVAAATGRVPSHAKSPEVYIAQRSPLRPEGKRKHRSTKAYARRQAKRHPVLPGGAS